MKTKHATTLSFITSDAVLTKPPEWKWQECINKSFNMINVDGDQSTNDISVFMANGAAGGKPVDDNQEYWAGVLYVLQSLAKQVVLDGEGETKAHRAEGHGARPTARPAPLPLDHLFQPVKTASSGRTQLSDGARGAGQLRQRVNIDKL
jgi:N-acetylglutamate synthase/N-acetylornithine aminotransferase